MTLMGTDMEENTAPFLVLERHDTELNADSVVGLRRIDASTSTESTTLFSTLKVVYRRRVNDSWTSQVNNCNRSIFETSGDESNFTHLYRGDGTRLLIQQSVRQKTLGQ